MGGKPEALSAGQEITHLPEDPVDSSRFAVRWRGAFLGRCPGSKEKEDSEHQRGYKSHSDGVHVDLILAPSWARNKPIEDP